MNWLSKMMMGRYGGDQLSMALVILSFALNFIPWFPFRILSLAILAVAAWRMFSKNIYKRSAENQVFLKVWYPVKNFFVKLFKRRPDAKTHKYVKCPKCHTTTRVPKNKGKIRITCPNCGEKYIKKT